MSAATDIIQEWGRLDSDAATTMSLYQEVADHYFVRENQITKSSFPGQDKSKILDPTGRLALQDMVAGMSAALVPIGSRFFRLSALKQELNDIGRVASYLNRLTALVHQEMLRANFLLEFTEWLSSLIAFGTGCLYSGWNQDDLMLTFHDWDVSNFRYTVDSYGRPDSCYIKWQYTARQAYGRWGDKAGEEIVKKAQDEKASQDKFTFIWRIRKRKQRDPNLGNNLNWPWEEICVNEQGKTVVSESGYRRFPYHISRWMLSSQEVWGRGQGTFALYADKALQTANRELDLAAALANTPPYEVDAMFEGKPNISPRGMNRVMQTGSIRPLDRGMQGDFRVTLEMVQQRREVIDKCFFRHVFSPLEGLTGDRRTTAEIYERTKEGLVRLIAPVTRLQYEGMGPMIENCTMTCIENHLIEPPPPELRTLKIDYLGRLALALQEQQVDAFQRFAQFAVNMDAVEPGFTRKSINLKRAGRRMATTFGMNEGDLNTEEEVATIEQQEAAQQQAMQAMQAMQAGGQAYKDMSKGAEEGSPADALMGAL